MDSRERYRGEHTIIDHTADIATAKVSSGINDPIRDPYLASPREVRRYEGFVFNPTRLVNNKQLRRMRYQVSIMKKKGG